MNESFIKIPTSLLEVNIPKNAIVLLGILQSNSKRLGYAYGSNRYYADKLNCSTRTKEEQEELQRLIDEIVGVTNE